MSKRTNLSNHIFNMFWSMDKWHLEDRATVYKIYRYFDNMSDDTFIKLLRTKQDKKQIGEQEH